MPRPMINVPQPRVEPKPPTKPTPTGLPAPKAPPKEDPKVLAATRAVEDFENQYRMLQEMKGDWEANYPEANLALRDILIQEDLVRDAINKAKPLIAEVKQSIGDFKATRKYSNAHYDEAEVTRILASTEQRLQIFKEMMDSGIIETVGLEKTAALAWFAQRPAFAQLFKSAFRDREEITCAVTVPKV